MVSGLPKLQSLKTKVAKTPFCHKKGTVHDRRVMMVAGKVLPVSRTKLAE